jgi:RecA-family ATPase
MVTVAVLQNVGRFPEKFTLPIQAGEIRDNRKRPGDDYNERADWATILQGAGWEISRIGQDKIYWRRAGKDDGISGTTGHCRTDGSGDMLYVFSSNAAPFQEAKAYSKFAAYTLLSHDGNFTAATRTLAGAGFGEPEVELNFLHKAKAEDAPLKIEPDPVTGLEYEIIGKMKRDTTERVWHWYGFVTGGGVTLFSAIWKIGKTTLLTGLLKSWIIGDSFLGQKVDKCKALVISEEHRDFWIDRHAETGVGDEDQHGVWCKPFTAQMTMKQWFEYVAQLAFIMQRDGFSVLIIDTISKIWPVKDENSATEVQQAINALDFITKPGMSVILVHHHRKGGGENHTASRGSGALSSAVDICMDFTREEGGYGNKSKTRRLITTTGRCGRATPYEVLIDFVDEQLVRLGDKDQVDTTARKKSIIEVLDKDTYYTLDQIQEASGQRQAFVRKHLEALVNDGEVEMIGTGGRGDKKRWRKVTIQQPTQNNLGDFNGSAQSL